MTTQTPIPETHVLDCIGYRTLLAAVTESQKKFHNDRDYTAQLIWAVDRARHYAEKTNIPAEKILDTWEERRHYWFLNYYQEAKIPLITTDKVRIFDTIEDLRQSIGTSGFRCPACNGISKSPYECDTGIKLKNEVCNWKVYGLFRDIGKGITVFVKEAIQADLIFMPVAWEQPPSTTVNAA